MKRLGTELEQAHNHIGHALCACSLPWQPIANGSLSGAGQKKLRRTRGRRRGAREKAEEEVEKKDGCWLIHTHERVSRGREREREWEREE